VISVIVVLEGGEACGIAVKVVDELAEAGSHCLVGGWRAEVLGSEKQVGRSELTIF